MSALQQLIADSAAESQGSQSEAGNKRDALCLLSQCVLDELCGA